MEPLREMHPDWRPLLAHRFEADAAEPEAEIWAEAMAHFDRCAECRRAAVAIDPTLGFRRLPSAVVSMSASQEADEVARMIAAVSVLRAEQRVTHRAERTPWARWSVAAALVLAVVSVGTLGNRSPHGNPGSAGSDRAERSPQIDAPQAAVFVPASSDLEISNGLSPRVGTAVEGIDRPDARIYQYDGDQMSVVMIVDESLDV